MVLSFSSTGIVQSHDRQEIREIPIVVPEGHMGAITARDTEILGREAELQTLDQFLIQVPAGPAAVDLEGDAGIGKTTLWKSACQGAATQGYRLLNARPAESEQHLPYAALSDLISPVRDDVSESLPGPQLHALDVALLRADSEGPPAEQRAIAAAVLTSIRALARQGPVVLAIDDEQWMDAPSSRVLRFAARRLDREPIGILLAHRSDRAGGLATDLERVVPPGRLQRLRIAPLSLTATEDLLLARLKHPFPRATVAHIHELAGGNPFFALEIGRHLISNGRWGAAGPLPIPDNLKGLVGERLARLPASVRQTLLVVVALSHPTIPLVQAVIPEAIGSLQRAVEAQVLEPMDGRLRFTHPIIGSVVYAEASDDDRRALHARLAALPLGPEEHARHRALAAAGPDAEVALALDVGARAANARGAPDAAAMLAEQGRDLTPVDRREDAHRRSIAAADYHLRAGATARARELLTSLDPGATGRARAQALQRLGKIEFTDGTLPEAERLYREALDQVGDDHRLRAVLERDLTNALLQQGHVETALEHIGNLEALGRRMDDAALVDRARTMRTFANGVLGHGLSADLRAHAVALAEGAAAIGAEQNPGVQHPLLDWGVILKWSDDFDHARSLFKAVLRTAEGRDESARAPALFHLGELESWAGDWLLAEVYAEECRKAILQTGQSAYRRLPLTLTGFLAAYRGDLNTAQVAAETALGEARRVGDMPYAQRNLRTLGVIELSRSRMDRADDWFRQLRDLLRIQKNREPGITRSAGDEIEVLIALGRLVEAGSLTECLEERGRTLDRAFAQATGARCRGLLLAASGDLAGALAALDRALEAHQPLPQPFELARTLMARGTVQRRGKQKRAARGSLQQATDIFERLGASAWVQRARAELERTGGSPAARHALTPTEARIAEMVAAGRTNREVSAQLFLSVKTVEANLSRIYSKLAVRSRSELAARLAKSAPP